ncbi:hypothetical protein COOONC_12455 [Cooperia oncophora]
MNSRYDTPSNKAAVMGCDVIVAIGQPEKDDDFILTPTQKCGLEAVDLYMQPATYTGYYHYRVSSDSLRLFPVTYKMITLDENGMEVQAINQKEKWIKPSTKALEETS